MDTITLQPSGCDTIDRIAAMQGDRIRVTYPNGYTRVGVVGVWSTRDGRQYGTLDGALMGGEFSPVVRIERMGANRRYEAVWAR
jgi:hypothetical protein